ncbi:hypothetical protein HYH02_013767 [Chlamydomonas schloesseri]|uniref:Uncharacterized protein n=1 Tax=Chlamydomonas schloesseri TaxID=2026947 RepID=A0A835VYH5_9CHLO|nr:hypothetical protein HYH02_013767 [Chlamydomonas schloesseri]|eukprot:KAG2430289.1 hypothetical protein HYH02_013767 [Chlamydomonas schloesseri]
MQANGTLDNSGALTLPSAAKRLKFSVHSRRGAHGGTQLVQASVGEIEFVGRSDGDENANTQPCCYALGVFSPAEGKLQLTAVASERLFRLDSRLQGLVYAPTGAGGDEDASAYAARKAAARRLVDEFGSTRRRRQMTAREQGVVAADRISGGEAVKEMLGGVAAAGQAAGRTKEEVQRMAFERRTIPPHNPSATTAWEAYPLELLLSPKASGQVVGNEVAAVRSRGSAVESELHTGQIYKLAEDAAELAKAREKNWLHPYVLSRLSALQALKSMPDDQLQMGRFKRRAKYLALLAALLRLESKPRLGIKAEGLEGLAKDLRLKQPLAELLLGKFYNRTDDPVHGPRYERPDALKALLLSYILAVAVVAEDGVLDKEQFEDLRAALKMDASKLSAALVQLGCSTKAGKVKVLREGREVEVPAYSASLLRNPDPRAPDAKTLAKSFPELRMDRPKAGGKK